MAKTQIHSATDPATLPKVNRPAATRLRIMQTANELGVVLTLDEILKFSIVLMALEDDAEQSE